MAFVALLQHAEALRHETVRVISRVVTRIVSSEGATRVHGCRRRCKRRTRRLRHRGRRRRLAKFLDANQNVLLMEFIFYTHILKRKSHQGISYALV